MNRTILTRIKELERKIHVPKKMVVIYTDGTYFKYLSNHLSLTLNEVSELREQAKNDDIDLMEIQIIKCIPLDLNI